MLSQVIGQPVLDAAGDKIAVIHDLVVRMGEDPYPPVTGLVARAGRRRFFIPWARVASLDERAARLATFKLDVQPFERRENEALLRRDVLDKQVIDVSGRRVIRANDLELAHVDGTWRVVGVDIGAGALLRRLAPKAWVRGRTAREVLDWAQVEYLATSSPAVHLKVSHERIARLHPVEIARLVESLSYREGAEIVAALDDATAAEAMEEMSDERQAELMEGMDAERAADILEEMDADEAADLLAEMEPETAAEILDHMEQEEKAEVEELLQHADDTAGGIMTNDYVAIPEGLTVAGALAYLRGLEWKPKQLYYLYVVESLADERLVGVVSLRDLVLAEPDQPLSAIMERDLQVAHPDDPAEQVARRIAEYNLLALPVVDEAGRLLGIVTFDDAMEQLIPQDWRHRLPRIFH